MKQKGGPDTCFTVRNQEGSNSMGVTCTFFFSADQKLRESWRWKVLTSAPLPSKMQNIASQHSGLLAEWARRERKREISMIWYSAEAGWAAASSIKHDTQPRSGKAAVVSPVAITHTHTHTYWHTEAQQDFKTGQWLEAVSTAFWTVSHSMAL